MNDIQYMNKALALAAKGRGFTSPNPMVGAVVVRENRIVGRGWHHAAGLAHAEVGAISDAGKSATGADLYVTLEPCNHYGKTPPCTRKIIEAGIQRVILATEDPNPFVSGGGIRCLRDKGITVEVGVCREEAETLIEDFIWYVQHDKKPFVILKSAATLDGRLATSTGDSRWITSPSSRRAVHELRHACDAVLVGSGTLKSDNPSLTARLDDVETRDPRRVILDSTLSISLEAKVLSQKSDADTIIATSLYASAEKCAVLESLGATVLRIPDKTFPVPSSMIPSKGGFSKGSFSKKIASTPSISTPSISKSSISKEIISKNQFFIEESGRLDLTILMEKLGEMGIMSILIEGGGGVAGSAISDNIINKIMFFLAPRILGGDDGVPVCRGKGPLFMKDAFQLKKVDMTRFDDDILISGYLK